MNRASSSGKNISGTSHWLLQRISAVILIPLTYPLIVFLNSYTHAPFQDTLAWIKTPANLIYMIIWLLAVFYHAAAGLQVVLEDYVGNRALQSILIKVTQASFSVLAVAALIFLYQLS